MNEARPVTQQLPSEKPHQRPMVHVHKRVLPRGITNAEEYRSETTLLRRYLSCAVRTSLVRGINASVELFVSFDQAIPKPNNPVAMRSNRFFMCNKNDRVALMVKVVKKVHYFIARF